MTDHTDDNVKTLKQSRNDQKPDLVGNARAAIEKGRKESYEAKVKAKMLVLSEQKKAVKITQEEIEDLVKEFEEGF
jgi:hypothetical protein